MGDGFFNPSVVPVVEVRSSVVVSSLATGFNGLQDGHINENGTDELSGVAVGIVAMKQQFSVWCVVIPAVGGNGDGIKTTVLDTLLLHRGVAISIEEVGVDVAILHNAFIVLHRVVVCLLYTSPSPRDS